MEDKNKPIMITLEDASFIGYIMSVCYEFHKKKPFLSLDNLIKMQEIQKKFLETIKLLN